VRRRRGQFALLGVIILAATLVVIVSQRPAEPVFALERGPMQSAQLIHLGRFCLATGCSNESLTGLLAVLLEFNESEPLYMYPIKGAYYRHILDANREEHYVFFNIVTLRGSETVGLASSAQTSPVLAKYEKVVKGRKTTFYNVTLTYCHAYSSPFFPAGGPACPLSESTPGGLTYCPRLYDPQGLAELTYLGYCTWRVSVPGSYTLYDEFGIPVEVRVAP